MLTGGFYAEVDLEYDAVIAQETERPAVRASTALRPIQLSTRDVLDDARRRARARSRLEQWKRLPAAQRRLRAGRASPSAQQDVLLLRMVPFVERNYNMVELGPRGTGKSHLFQQISPYAHLVSGGKATVAQHVRQQRHRPARARRPVRRRLLRRGLRRLLRPEGRRQHHEGLHGVRRVQPRARRASAPTAAS